MSTRRAGATDPVHPAKYRAWRRAGNGVEVWVVSVIDVRGLRKTYGSLVDVDDLDLTVEEGEIFDIVGPNGAGKTTTRGVHHRPEGARQRNDSGARL